MILLSTIVLETGYKDVGSSGGNESKGEFLVKSFWVKSCFLKKNKWYWSEASKDEVEAMQKTACKKMTPKFQVEKSALPKSPPSPRILDVSPNLLRYQMLSKKKKNLQ